MKRPFVVHPLLVAIFPTLFLYAYNVREMTGNQIILPIAVTVGLAIVLWVVSGLLLRSIAKGGLVASVCVLALSTYGHLFNLLAKQQIFPVTHYFLIPAVVIAVCGCVFWIQRARGDLRNWTQALNVGAAVLIAVNLFNIGLYKIHTADTNSVSARAFLPSPAAEASVSNVSDSSAFISGPLTTGESMQTTPFPFASANVSGDSSSSAGVVKKVPAKPDVYLIVLDEYAGSETMKRLYGLDDSEFTGNLEKMGFFVAPNSKMHNYMTSRAVASILNMEYTPESEPTDVTIERTMHSEVVSYFHAKGYTHVYLGQLYEQCPQRSESADLYINYYQTVDQGPVSIPFSSILRQTTALGAIDDSSVTDHDAAVLREAYLKTLDHLVQMPAMSGPKFVYAHIMGAHTPYVFGADGEHVSRDVPEKDAYLGQYVFTTRVIQGVIQQILANSVEEPIIILQSDHGPRWSGDWTDILNAYYLPGDVAETLPDDISPINTFRVIFNSYLGGDFPLLPNK